MQINTVREAPGFAVARHIYRIETSLIFRLLKKSKLHVSCILLSNIRLKASPFTRYLVVCSSDTVYLLFIPVGSPALIIT